MRRPAWQIVLPVKGGPSAKSRLRWRDGERAALARAMSMDCCAAVMATRVVTDVVVVTQDDASVREAVALGARVVPESRPGAGLLAAVGDGLAAVAPGPVAILLADLPALVPEELDVALAAATCELRNGAAAVVVPDADGTGSVLLAAADRSALRPAFGEGSARAHELAGAVRLSLELPRLRRDVDTAEALVGAMALGVGRRTAAITAALQPVPA